LIAMTAREPKRPAPGRASLGALATLLGLALSLGAAGCGGDESAGQPAPATEPAGQLAPATAPAEQPSPVAKPAEAARLTGEERRLVSVYDRRIQAHCVRVTRALVEPRAAPTRAQEERAFAAADALLALAAEKPNAPLGAGQDLRLLVSDVTENIEGSNCDPRMIARLEQGLASLPPR